MSNSISVLTDNSKAVVEGSAESYQGNVLAHIYGDWGYHNAMRIYNIPFAQPATGYTVTDKSLRMLLSTPAGVNLVVIVPIEQTGTLVAGGGAPIILQGPSDLTLPVGSNAQFSVVVASQEPPLFQWSKNGSAVLGGNSALYLLTNVTTLDAGTYACAVYNSYGSAVSNDAFLVVTTSTTGGGSGQLPIITYQQPNPVTTVVVNATANPLAYTTIQLAIDVASDTAVSFQWQKDGVDIVYSPDVGAPTTYLYESSWGGHAHGSVLTLTLRPGTAADSGQYRVICTNANGNVLSTPWVISVI